MKKFGFAAIVAAAALALLVTPAGAQQIPIVCPSGPGCLSVPYSPAPMTYAPGYGYGYGGYYATSRGITRIQDTIGVVERVIWLPAQVAGAIRTAEGIWRLPPPQYPQPQPYPGR